jgi:hypothetical protein
MIHRKASTLAAALGMTKFLTFEFGHTAVLLMFSTLVCLSCVTTIIVTTLVTLC